MLPYFIGNVDVNSPNSYLFDFISSLKEEETKMREKKERRGGLCSFNESHVVHVSSFKCYVLKFGGDH